MIVQGYKSTFFLLLVFLATIWGVKHTPEKQMIKVPTQTTHTLDYFSVNYQKVQMDEQGLPHDQLIADYVEHFSDNGETQLRNPVMTLYKQATPPWVTRSETGVITKGADKVFLNGRVYIDREAASNVREIHIKTTNLRIEPKRNYAETDEWAELVTELDTMSGIGMRLFYQDPLYIELLAQVRGRHDYQ